jgi:hypothetical protein
MPSPEPGTPSIQVIHDKRFNCESHHALGRPTSPTVSQAVASYAFDLIGSALLQFDLIGSALLFDLIGSAPP